MGGIVAEAKKVRTRSGGYVMFAKLDDLEGQVELFVRDATSEQAEAIALDRVVLVRGRVDQKGRDQMSVVVHEASPFEPDADELAKARARAKKRGAPSGSSCESTPASGRAGRGAEGPVRGVPGRHGGFARDGDPRRRARRLRFGDGYRVDPITASAPSWTSCSGRRRSPR